MTLCCCSRSNIQTGRTDFAERNWTDGPPSVSVHKTSNIQVYASIILRLIKETIAISFALLNSWPIEIEGVTSIGTGTRQAAVDRFCPCRLRLEGNWPHYEAITTAYFTMQMRLGKFRYHDLG